MRAAEFNEGIYPIPAGQFRGGKSSLEIPRNFKNTSIKLPGGSGFVYTITPSGYTTEITIWDPKGPDYINAAPQPVRKPREAHWAFTDRVKNWNNSKIAPGQLIGKLEISSVRWFPLPNAVAVEVITVDEDYRGQGIAKALYGIVLTIMKLPLVAGDSQTPGGRINWVSLASIPGVEVKGSGIWNVGAGLPHSFLDIAEYIAEQEGVPIEYEPVSQQELTRFRNKTCADLKHLKETVGTRKWLNVYEWLDYEKS